MKHFLILFLISSGILPVFLSCFCKQETPHWNITNFELRLFDDLNENILSGDTIIVDTLKLNLSIKSVFVARSGFNVFGAFGNQLYAFQCPQAGEYGLRNKIKSISISCDKDINSYAPNDELVGLSLINDQSISEFLSRQENLRHFDDIIIKILEKPNQQDLRSFKIKMVFEDLSELSRSSVAFYW